MLQRQFFSYGTSTSFSSEISQLENLYQLLMILMYELSVLPKKMKKIY